VKLHFSGEYAGVWRDPAPITHNCKKDNAFPLPSVAGKLHIISKAIVMEKSDQSNEQTRQDAKKQSAWKGSSPEDVTGKQRDTNKAMGNAANRPQKKDQTKKSGQTNMNEDDADQMGSGKRQDDN
jgi:hypothetical protein